MKGKWDLAFDLKPSGEMVAFVGGGGKSSLMFALAKALPGHVVTTTTTRIFAAQMKLAPAVCSLTGADNGTAPIEQGENPDGTGLDRTMITTPLAIDELGTQLSIHDHCLVVGEVAGEKASGVPVDVPGRLLSRTDVDIVLVEADGSRMRPSKAPAAHEPVIPAQTTLVVPVVGIDAIGGRVADVAHRPELVSNLTGLKTGDSMTVEALALLITHASGGLKDVPAGARLIPFINKVDRAEKLRDARQVARLCLKDERIERVVIGAIRSSWPIREVHRRVTAVVLAAGESERMGKTKQLLPWGQTTVLGQTIMNLQSSDVNEILVVVGHDAAATTAVAGEFGVSTVHNPDYASGEMISSLKKAVEALPSNRSSVVVVLGDQPMVGAETIDQLIHAYWRGEGEIIAPAYHGKRGNPVLISRKYFEQLLRFPPGVAPRELLKRNPESLYHVAVLDPSVLLDLDSPEQYERLRPK